eukprot:3009175-Pyramimonas_sp.AAC.1
MISLPRRPSCWPQRVHPGLNSRSAQCLSTSAVLSAPLLRAKSSRQHLRRSLSTASPPGRGPMLTLLPSSRSTTNARSACSHTSRSYMRSLGPSSGGRKIC